MAVQEIVGAIIDSAEVTTDWEAIKRSVSAGQHIEYITRKRARTVASFSSKPLFARLASSPTLFVMDGGVKFMKPMPSILFPRAS